MGKSLTKRGETTKMSMTIDLIGRERIVVLISLTEVLLLVKKTSEKKF